MREPNADLENRFTFHPVTGDEQAKKYETVRSTTKNLAYLIDDLVPDSREKSLAWTALEEAVAWANAGIARHNEDGARVT